MVSNLALRLLMHTYPTPFNKETAMEIYTNETSLRRTIHYFKSAGFLECVKNSDHTMTYYFTHPGITFVELLLKLPDTPTKYRQKAMLTRFDIELGGKKIG